MTSAIPVQFSAVQIYEISYIHLNAKEYLKKIKIEKIIAPLKTFVM